MNGSANEGECQSSGVPFIFAMSRSFVIHVPRNVKFAKTSRGHLAQFAICMCYIYLILSVCIYVCTYIDTADTKIELVLDMSMGEIRGKEEEFKNMVRLDVAKAVGGDLSKIYVVRLDAGSIIVTMLLAAGVRD